MMDVVKYMKKMKKKMVKLFTRRTKDREENMMITTLATHAAIAIASSKAAAAAGNYSSIYCDQLFDGRRIIRHDEEEDGNSYLAGYIAAQNYFSLRPSIYL
ncbi:hypothetical protein Dimus_019683 [Dionaea muscipula]